MAMPKIMISITTRQLIWLQQQCDRLNIAQAEVIRRLMDERIDADLESAGLKELPVDEVVDEGEGF